MLGFFHKGKKDSKPHIQIQGKEKSDAGRDGLFHLIPDFQNAEQL